MKLAKWITSEREIEKLMEGEVEFQQIQTPLVQTNQTSELTKALGVYWNPITDKYVNICSRHKR